MPNLIYVIGRDFRTFLADIEDTTADDFVGEFSATEGNFRLSTGEVVSFRSVELEPSLSSTLFFWDMADGGGTIWWDFRAAIEFDDGFDLQSALNTRVPSDLPEPLFKNTLYLTAFDTVTIGFDQPESFQSFGKMYGRGGDDEFFMGIDNVPLDVRPTEEPRVAAFGNLGDDVFHIDAPRAAAIGGWGDDTFAVYGGDVGLWGGRGADTFIFDGAAPLTRYISATDRTFAIIRGFEAEDTVIFGDTQGDDLPDFIFSPQGPTTSFAELFGTDDLSTLQRETVDGVTFLFNHAPDGDARIFRRGEDADGNTYTENVRFDGISLAELDPTQIFVATFESIDL